MVAGSRTTGTGSAKLVRCFLDARGTCHTRYIRGAFRYIKMHSHTFHVLAQVSALEKSLLKLINLWSPWCLAAPRISTGSWKGGQHERHQEGLPNARLDSSSREGRRYREIQTDQPCLWVTERPTRKNDDQPSPGGIQRPIKKNVCQKVQDGASQSAKAKKTPGRDKHSWRRKPRREQRKLPRLGRRHGKLRDLPSTLRHMGAAAEGLQHKHHIMLPLTPWGSAGAWCDGFANHGLSSAAAKVSAKEEGPFWPFFVSARRCGCIFEHWEDEMQEPAPARPSVTADSLGSSKDPRRRC